MFIRLESFDRNLKVKFLHLLFIVFLTHALERSKIIGFGSLNLFGIIGFEFFLGSSEELPVVVFELLLFDFAALVVIERIPGLQHLTPHRAFENDQAGAAEHEDDDQGDDHSSDVPLARGEGAVFPDDVCGLRGLLNLDFAAQKLVVLQHLLLAFGTVLVDGVRVDARSRIAFLAHHRDEDRAWPLLLVQTLLLLDHLQDFVVDLLHVAPRFAFDFDASENELLDDFGVVVGKRDLRDLDLLGHVVFSRSIQTQGVHFVEPLFKLELDIEFELRDFSHRVRVIVVILDEVVEMLFVQLEFEGVIAGCDGLHVKVDELVHLHAGDVVEVHD